MHIFEYYLINSTLENKVGTYIFRLMPPNPAAHLLTRQTYRRPGDGPLMFLEGLGLERARTHEFCGQARRTLAIAVLRATTGPVIWIRPDWAPDKLNPDGIVRFIDPARLIFISPRRPEDLLWATEEALRAGIVPLVVADLPGPPGLTPIRRLHLAAETGAKEGRVTPLGLILTPGDGGAPGIESRWSFNPQHAGAGRSLWTLSRLRARTAPQKVWQVTADKGGFRLVDHVIA